MVWSIIPRTKLQKHNGHRSNISSFSTTNRPFSFLNFIFNINHPLLLIMLHYLTLSSLTILYISFTKGKPTTFTSLISFHIINNFYPHMQLSHHNYYVHTHNTASTAKSKKLLSQRLLTSYTFTSSTSKSRIQRNRAVKMS